MMSETENKTGAEILPLIGYRKTMNSEPITVMKRHWAGLQAGRQVPHRSEVDPRAISETLETGFIVERTEPGMVRFRLAGLGLCDLMGMEVRGMPLRSFIAPASRAEFSVELERVFETPEIHEYTMISENGTNAPLAAKMVILPLRSEGGEIDRAIGCIVTDGSIGLAPRRFRVVETVRTSIETGAATKQVSTDEIKRFADASRPIEVPAHAAPDAPDAPRARPYLRVVK